MSKQEVELDNYQFCVFIIWLMVIMIWLINIEQETCRIRKALEAPALVEDANETQ